ncbi:MAG: hypothetical protein FD143_1861 [Ignavibacteria bacterium]|nr:MAG: hypothetical protein FD143_1861 [Ignavibacteria bacterium]KAF0159843.1 MAG: hypothetical protein FD188_2078 [Ignavibacteria bacterium]
MVKIFRLTFLLFALSFVSVDAQSISVSAATDTTSYKVGDYITLALEFSYNKSIKVEIPSVKDSIKVLDYIQTLPSEKKESEGMIVELHKFIFSKYDSAVVTIPSLLVYYTEANNTDKKFLATTPITITINKLQINPQEDIRDVKEPMLISLPWWIILLIILGIVVLAVGIYYLYNFLKKRKEGKAEIKTELIFLPHEIALAKLDELDGKKLWQSGKIKEYHTEVTQIVREYFENRFKFRALEMPSSEILSVLSYLEEANTIVETADKFFTNADLVKFAKFEPMPQVNDEMLKQAYEIVKQTITTPVNSTKVGEVNV